MMGAALPAYARVAAPGPTLGPYHIVYRDSVGDLTDRDITIRQVRRVGNDIEVRAWCHLVHDERTFVASRMLEIIDLSTGRSEKAADVLLAPMVAADAAPVASPQPKRPGAIVAGSLIVVGVVGSIGLLAFIGRSPPPPLESGPVTAASRLADPTARLVAHPAAACALAAPGIREAVLGDLWAGQTHVPADLRTSFAQGLSVVVGAPMLLSWEPRLKLATCQGDIAIGVPAAAQGGRPGAGPNWSGLQARGTYTIRPTADASGLVYALAPALEGQTRDFARSMASKHADAALDSAPRGPAQAASPKRPTRHRVAIAASSNPNAEPPF
jgi:hypothetical protein